jgi:ribose transport system substrate-binding protein
MRPRRLSNALRKEELSGLLLQDPVRMGYLGVIHAVDILQGVIPEKRIDTGAWVAIAPNMGDPEIKKD